MGGRSGVNYLIVTSKIYHPFRKELCNRRFCCSLYLMQSHESLASDGIGFSSAGGSGLYSCALHRSGSDFEGMIVRLKEYSRAFSTVSPAVKKQK